MEKSTTTKGSKNCAKGKDLSCYNLAYKNILMIHFLPATNQVLQKRVLMIYIYHHYRILAHAATSIISCPNLRTKINF